MTGFARRRDRAGRLAVALVSIPATFGYLSIWTTTTDLALHEQYAATAGLSFAHLALAAVARSIARDSA